MMERALEDFVISDSADEMHESPAIPLNRRTFEGRGVLILVFETVEAPVARCVIRDSVFIWRIAFLKRDRIAADRFPQTQRSIFQFQTFTV